MIDLQRTIKGKEMCFLCPNVCILDEGETGECGVRTNKHGNIGLDTYGMISAMAIEPIEKKPITHYLPGTKTLSCGSINCSFHCSFCENHKISQKKQLENTKTYNPEDITKLAKQYNCSSVCMTYNEPTISYEFLMDLAQATNSNGLSFVLKTNGYVNKSPWVEICRVADSINLDWKGNADSYRSIAGAKEYVILDRIEEAYKSGVHVEISIPLHNKMKDEHLEEFGQFLSNISDDIPCHLLKIQAAYKHSSSTSNDRVDRAKDILERYMNIITIH